MAANLYDAVIDYLSFLNRKPEPRPTLPGLTPEEWKRIDADIASFVAAYCAEKNGKSHE